MEEQEIAILREPLLLVQKHVPHATWMQRFLDLPPKNFRAAEEQMRHTARENNIAVGELGHCAIQVNRTSSSRLLFPCVVALLVGLLLVLMGFHRARHLLGSGFFRWPIRNNHVVLI
jgi:hypothetical protein